ncbi:peptide chain release factor H [Vibrio nigripulchritudo]|uniref:peptide chain release factor H n=1 Tax=Vibrio nigripulchritudo TaxID=28173 RepID=UPI00190A600D|nr:peptide chain release factor H [Vibrio nigripulchritudo]BCL71931.1 peptide chain release factor H [Vibrio nigripulchritudo]BDU33289.1 peptide chain release factor H [Vibrio nigripulchritudo]
MILLQLTAGQGPTECCLAVKLALKHIEKQCGNQGIRMDVLDLVGGSKNEGYKSVLLQLESKQPKVAQAFAQQWQGSILWVCKSPVRPRHKRKNWFISGQVYDVSESSFDQEVCFQTCRASGSGGQHVNTTDSAVRATHVETGLSVRVESERSQHSNKRLARVLLFQKLEQMKESEMSVQEKQRWQQHWEVERGNPVQTFKGESFRPV